MKHLIENWLAAGPDLTADPIASMRDAGLLTPAPDYTSIARVKALLVERTGLLGIGGVWGGQQLVFRHFLAFGTEAQRAAWAGKALAVGISEPKVGAHPKLLTTRAEATEGGYRITGQKAWVSNGPTADAIIVFAITAEEAGRKRYSAFIVPRGIAGLTTADMPGFHALRPSRHCLLTLEGCMVPASAILGEAGSAYERMALPFRDVEDAVGTFGTLGALRFAIGRFAGVALEQATELGAIVALTAVFAAGAEAVVASLDAGRFRTGNSTLVGLRLLAQDIAARLRTLADHAPVAAILADLDATFGIARGPRLARQTQFRGGGAVPPVRRCHWAEGSDAVMQAYHDQEWGVPQHDDRALFELLTLEGAQAGLSWRTVLVRRPAYRAAYHDFDIERVAGMTDADLEALLAGSPLIRNRLKIFSVRDNAQAALAAAAQHGSLDRYLWSFVGHTPIRNGWTERSQVPATTPVSDAMSKALKKSGFRFVGSTICYAFMQASGMVDDHLIDCYRHTQE